MNIEPLTLMPDNKTVKSRSASWNANLVLYFGSRKDLESGDIFHQIKTMFPTAVIVGCTTGGQIQHNDMVDDSFAGVAVRFSTTQIRFTSEIVASAAESHACGRRIAERLKAADLAGIFVLSDGLNVNGSRLITGLTDVIGQKVPVVGGLAGDGAQFQSTLVGADAAPRTHAIAAIGFYGQDIRIGHGSAGGWDVFGPTRRITRSDDNVLFELDGEGALDLYERYLGDEADDLPGSGLLFPLQIYDPAQPHHRIVRTILGIDRATRALTFAGDMPLGWNAQLMRGDFDRLSDGAADAARQASRCLEADHDAEGLALLVSCIGRRLLMGQRIPEEIEATSAELGPRLHRLGFYSYGEISPHAISGHCELHNQTMTVTTITESAVG